jgi:hypothetical protein
MKKVLIATFVALFYCLAETRKRNASARCHARDCTETSNEVEVTDFDRYEGKIV